MKNLIFNIIIIVLIIFTIISGIYYLTLQQSINHEIIDLIYVILLCFAASLLFLSFVLIKIWVKRKIKTCNLLPLFQPILDSLQSFNSLIFGFVYGIAAVVVFAILLNVWDNNDVLKYSLLLFQFFVGALSGFGFYQVLNFVFQLVKITKTIKISFFHVHSPVVLFIQNSIRIVALLTSIYVSICISSILFTEVIHIQNIFVTIYSVLSFSLILLIFFIPLIPISQKIKKTKNESLYEIENKLFEIYEQEIHSGKKMLHMETLESFDTFLKFRSEIMATHNWPFINNWLTTVATVFVSSITPVILEQLLQTTFLNSFVT